MFQKLFRTHTLSYVSIEIGTEFQKYLNFLYRLKGTKSTKDNASIIESVWLLCQWVFIKGLMLHQKFDGWEFSLKNVYRLNVILHLNTIGNLLYIPHPSLCDYQRGL